MKSEKKLAAALAGAAKRHPGIRFAALLALKFLPSGQGLLRFLVIHDYVMLHFSLCTAHYVAKMGLPPAAEEFRPLNADRIQYPFYGRQELAGNVVFRVY